MCSQNTRSGQSTTSSWVVGPTYLVGIVEVHYPVPVGRDVLVALRAPAHAQRRIHVHVVAGEVKRDQALEDDAPAGEGLGKEHKQAGRGAAIGDHVQHGTELGALFVVAGCVAVERVEEARHAVERGACARVEGHVVEGREGEDDSAVAWVVSVSCVAAVVDMGRPTDQVGNEEEDVLLYLLFGAGGAHGGAIAVDGFLCRGHDSCVVSRAGNLTRAETTRDLGCSRLSGETRKLSKSEDR